MKGFRVRLIGSVLTVFVWRASFTVRVKKWQIHQCVLKLTEGCEMTVGLTSVALVFEWEASTSAARHSVNWKHNRHEIWQPKTVLWGGFRTETTHRDFPTTYVGQVQYTPQSSCPSGPPEACCIVCVFKLLSQNTGKKQLQIDTHFWFCLIPV